MPLSSITCGDTVSEECSTNHPTITLTGNPLTATDTMVVLRAVAIGSVVWQFLGNSAIASFVDRDHVGKTSMLGSATAELTGKDGTNFTSTLSIPLANVFSTPTLRVTNSQLRMTNIQLCPGS